VESGKTGDQRLMLNTGIHRLIHHPSITASLMGENHPYKKSYNFHYLEGGNLRNANYVPAQNF